ncbi:MAG: 5-formyltetrahydrofolate cyclo-ligase [Chloroflexota bacterium]
MTIEVDTLVPAKDALRRSVWEALQDSKVARFPGAWGRIPNFTGAETAAGRARGLDAWQRAQVVKCNPDAPQLPLRRAALQDGKVVYMAVPRLRSEKCFIEIDPSLLNEAELKRAASIAGSAKYGRPVHPREMPAIDLIVTGVVAANREGARLGKGGGYSDLEYSLLAEMGKITPETPIITTAHRLQVLDEEIQMRAHDIPLDYIVTPDEVIECPPNHRRRPAGIDWRLLTRERIAQMPALAQLWREASGGQAEALQR